MPFPQLPPHCLPPNEWNCQRLKATTPFSQTFPSIASDRYLLSEISPFPLPSSLTTRRFLNFPSSIALYLTFCLSAFGFGPRLVAGHGNSHLSWHPSSWTSCIHIISCDWSPGIWETEMWCVPNFPAMKWQLVFNNATRSKSVLIGCLLSASSFWLLGFVVRIPTTGRLSGSCFAKDALCAWTKRGCKILKLNNFQISELFVSVYYLFDWFIFHHFNPFHMFHRWRFCWSSWSVGGKSTHDGARLRKRRRLLVEQTEEILKPF